MIPGRALADRARFRWRAAAPPIQGNHRFRTAGSLAAAGYSLSKPLALVNFSERPVITNSRVFHKSLRAL
jgi:hypothetical protein